MTNDWHTRAVVAEQKLADAKRELELFYLPTMSSDGAIEALHRLKALLGVDVKRGYGVAESLTVEVDYRVEVAK